MTTADRDADIFDVDRLEDARRYMALVTRGHQGPFRVVGGVDRVDTAYLDGARNDLCATIAPWIANRYARYLADENCRAVAQERQIIREIGNLKNNLAAATQARIAADRACAGFVAGYARRGDAKGSAK